MKKRHLAIALFASSAPMLHGAAFVYDELIWVTENSSFSFTDPTTVFYEIDSDSSGLFGASEFQGADLGSFTVGDELYLTGEQKSDKDNSTDVIGHTLFWSLDGGSTFSTLGYGFQSDLGDGNQVWGAANAGNLTSNILDGLGAGSYTLSVWSTVTTDGVNSDTTIFNTNGGSNYNATFSVVPEPSVALLGAFGILGILRRRRP
ncbi:PEP-CTERM sorting domain-containing protein [Haloferula rosea]|uniref:PEP-CTERM sorting domain-containing protein n=1 Tax=Haloferula rosea TaxID=490093 RepID=A0A934R676_9BACT|nr:PEP-CTERM sorting domain-containing protein [Haloferula rosea]MBK1826049.1 PEP-CTERM sorting domain-containing protein [Haloferula rosea]